MMGTFQNDFHMWINGRTAKVGSYNVSYLDGTFIPNYSFELVKPILSSSLIFEDGLVKFTLQPSSKNISFNIQNKTNEPIQIDWNKVSYIDENSKTHKVIHDGVKFIDKTNSLPPTFIPPTASLDDFIVPSDLISLSTGRYGGWNQIDLLPTGMESKKVINKTIGLFIPVETDKGTKNYFFSFKIKESQ